MSTIFEDVVEVQSIVFNHEELKPSQAIKFNIDALDGWDATAELNAESMNRGVYVDGEEMLDFQTYKARHIFVSGYLYAANREDLDSLVDSVLRDAFPRNVDLRLTRLEAVSKYITCRRSGKVDIDKAADGTWARFTVPVTAEDPLKYDTLPSSGVAGTAGRSTTGRSYPRTYPLSYSTIDSGAGTIQNSVTILNRGNTNTKPSVVISGPLASGWRLVNETTVKEIRFDVSFGSGETLVLDFKKEIALLNGSLVMAAISGDFWPVPPGYNVIKLYADYDAATAFAVAAESAWE